MGLQEAINHAREVAYGCQSDNRDCAYQHDKLADWLEELKSIKDILGNDYDLDRLRELVKADRDGRAVILPVKVGGMVYRVITTRDCPPLLSEIEIKTVEQAASLIGHMGKHLVISYYHTLEAAKAALKGEGDCS